MIVDYANVTLHELYSEWFDYKVKTVARSTTAFRIDADWRKFYENDPLSAGIISTPIFQIRRTDVEIWAAGLIRKYKMTRKCWCNAFTPMRQMLLYAMDRGDIDVSSIISIHLNSSLFFKQRKPDADTQIFFDDEVRLVIDAAVEACMQTMDESYLAIPICLKTGIRLGECLGLQFNDFDLKTNTMKVRRSLLCEYKVDEKGHWYLYLLLFFDD